MRERILVTGGAGFVGSTLVRKLLDRGYKVTVLDNLSTGLQDYLPKNEALKLVVGNVENFEYVSSVVRGHQKVMHLAAQAFIPFSYQEPLHVAEVNAIGSINIFKACLNHKVKRLVHISSSEVYGSAQYTPMDEACMHGDNSKARKMLGWNPKTRFDEGIQRTVNWYIDEGKMWGYEKRKWHWRY